MKRAIIKNLPAFGAIIALTAIGLVVTFVILKGQDKMAFPWEDEPVRMTAVLDDASAVTPGQGQAVQVAGVQIGQIADVELKDGRAHVGLDIDKKYVDEGLVRTDARAFLRPRTPLEDMYIQLLPGKSRERAGDGFTVPVDRTMSDVELEEILAELDERTRDYLTLLVQGAGRGLKGNGERLAEVFRRFGPTMKDLARVNRAVGQERGALRRLVTSLADLNEHLAEKPQDLSELVTASESTFGAFAAEDQNLRATIGELPATLRQATRTLQDVRPLADELGPATRSLIPAMQALAQANRAVRPAARTTLPFVRDQIRPFVREARPVVQDLRPAATDLARAFPELRRSGRVLNRFFNMLGFNKDGKQEPGAAGRDEGYLYWLAWTAHNGANLINV
ncbi:MAG TPA: MlaD family protein, partial [Baekduia sp.]|nr:MlaD family protein [Baekduia sp.]